MANKKYLESSDFNQARNPHLLLNYVNVEKSEEIKNVLKKADDDPYKDWTAKKHYEAAQRFRKKAGEYAEKNNDAAMTSHHKQADEHEKMWKEKKEKESKNAVQKSDTIIKGAHKTHKYLRKEGDKYIYHESYTRGKGGKAHHHKMLQGYHEEKMRDAHQGYSSMLSKLSSSDHPTTDSMNKLKQLSESAIEHAKQAAHHKREHTNFAADLDGDEYKHYDEISTEHEHAGIFPKQYGEAYHEHMSSEAKAAHRKIIYGLPFNRKAQNFSELKDYKPNEIEQAEIDKLPVFDIGDYGTGNGRSSKTLWSDFPTQELREHKDPFVGVDKEGNKYVFDPQGYTYARYSLKLKKLDK